MKRFRLTPGSDLGQEFEMARPRSRPLPKRDLYQEITDRILAILDRSVVPWRNPLRRQGGGGWPKNLASKKPYRGINVFLLAITSWERGYGSDYWLTFRQAKQTGGTVKQGEKASLVTFWKLYATADRESGEEVKVPVLRHYSVFNVEQCEGIEAPDRVPSDPDTPPFEPLAACESIVEVYEQAPLIEHRSGPARYIPSRDQVWIPAPDAFTGREDYYAVLFHELVHSTGHKSRLDRGFEESPAPFGSPAYGKEELIAEMGAAFLAAAGGISPPTIEQSAAYIENWKRQIQGDTRLVVSAAGAAQRAADRILGVTFDADDEPTSSTSPASLSPDE